MHRDTPLVISISAFPRRVAYRGCVVCVVAIALLCLTGCTSLCDYFRNGFKVGPNYCQPPAPVAQHWIDADDVRISSEDLDDCHWWAVFNDPLLCCLVETAYHQNLTLREAGFRVLQARAERGIAVGQLFPQSQTMSGSYVRRGVSESVANRVATPQRWFGQWDFGGGLAWELDFWGRFRRAVEAADAQLDASVANYDDVLVVLIGDVAGEYVRIRMFQTQIGCAQKMVGLQRESLGIAAAKYKGGQVSKIDVNQAQSDVSNTEALIQQLEVSLRKSCDRLCILLGRPAEDLIPMLGNGPIPMAPAEVAVGIPAQLIARRPDIRRAERLAAAECARIGVAKADFFPQISLNASFGWSAQYVSEMFSQPAFRGSVGPAFQWPILNYGRIANNVRARDARFQQQVTNYQQTVLNAGAEVEDGLVTFLRGKLRARDMEVAVRSETEAFQEVLTQYNGGLIDYNRVALIQERLVERQQTLADAEAQVAQGLVQTFRALGGGWQIRYTQGSEIPVAATSPAEASPAPTAPIDPVPAPPQQPLPTEGPPRPTELPRPM
jgi:NodT family efflux transporter outer membrane factor (OMF) lipoprotein